MNSSGSEIEILVRGMHFKCYFSGVIKINIFHCSESILKSFFRRSLDLFHSYFRNNDINLYDNWNRLDT